MKRNFKFVALLVITVLVCSGTLALTLARAERSESTGVQLPNLASSESAPAAINQGGKNYKQDVAKVLKQHDSLELEPQRVAEQVRLTGRLSLPTAEGTFELNLAPYDMLAPNYRAQVTLDGGEVRSIERGPVRTYKGTVAGMDGAQARFTIDDDTLEGLIITRSDLYFVEPASRYSSSASTKDFIVYKASDLIRTSFGECGVTLAEKVGSKATQVESHVPTAMGPGAEELFSPPRRVDFATEADFEYFTNFGSAAAANNEIISIMNQVEGIYTAQFGLQFTIVFQNVWATASDPYTTTEPDAALDQFRDYWNTNHGTVARDLVHMWTGKNFDGNTVGIAFRIPGMECPLGTGGYGISQRLPGNPSPDKFLLAAHEIGHNFGAHHPQAPDVDPVPPNCVDTIMSASLGPATMSTFCPFSVNEIETRANATVACLPQAITPGCTYSISPMSQSFPVNGGSGSITLTTTGSSCAWGTTPSVSWISINSGNSGTNNGTISFTVSPNIGGFARSGIINVANRVFTVTQAGAAACAATPISYGQTINASLSSSDCRSSQQSTTFADQYSFSGTAGDQIRIEMTSTPPPLLDTYLYLIGPNGTVLTQNDDIDFGVITDSRIPVNGFFTLPATGQYVIESTAFDDSQDRNEVGPYRLVLTSSTTPATFTISGRMTDQNGNGVGSGAAIVLSGSRNDLAIIDSNGNYSFLNLTGGGNYTVTPGSQGAQFSYTPPSYVFNNLSANQTANFVRNLVPTLTISGRVTDPVGTGIPNVQIEIPGSVTGSALTDGNGNYSIAVLPGANYTVTPTTFIYTYSPPAFIFNNLNASQTANFTATRRTINLSGRVIQGSTGLAGVTVWLLHQASQQAVSTVTAADGTYGFNGALLNDFYEVIPFKDGYRFNPPSLILPASQSNLGDITATLGNPIDGSTFFVTKHYEDFFGRQPDAPGLAFWVNGINGCDPFVACREGKRIDTSAAFFLSIEFQQTGYLVYRLYKVGYGDLPGKPFPVRRAAFIQDTRTIGNGVVVGQAGWEAVLEGNKQSFVANFVNLASFTTANPTTTTPAQFVDTLFARGGVTPSAADRQAAIDEFGIASTSADAAARARALRRVAENSLLNAQEFNKAFVLMQYFGYLQRNPDDAPDTDLAGYNFWLTKLNQFNGDFRQAEMVKAFITSSEYRSRFGPP